MLQEKSTRSDAELRQEFSKMQRAQFILWLVEHDEEALAEVREASAIGDADAEDWETVRARLNKQHNV